MQSTRSVDVPEVCKETGIKGDPAADRVPVLLDQVIQVSGSNVDSGGVEGITGFFVHNVQQVHVSCGGGAGQNGLSREVVEGGGLARLWPRPGEIIVHG